MRKEFAYAISQGCAEVYYCTANGDYAKPPLKESRGTYTGNVAECPCCGHTIRQDQYEDYTCEECGELWEDDDLDWHPDGDEYEDGYDNREGFDLLELMSESTNLKDIGQSSLNESRIGRTKRIKFNDPDVFEKIDQTLQDIQNEYGKRCYQVYLNVKLVYGYNGHIYERNSDWFTIPCEDEIKEEILDWKKWDKKQNYAKSLLISFEIRPYIMSDKELKADELRRKA